MKQLLLAAAMLLTINVMAQTSKSDFDISKDAENGAVVYKGQISFDDLGKEGSFGWLKRGSDAYKPDTNAVKYLKKNLVNYEIVVFMGTWCEDSQNLIPKFYKLLQVIGYPMGKLTMYGVDRAKTAKYIEHRLYKIEKVPTIIVYRNHSELGRITELVKKSIETDLINIIRDDVEKQAAAQQK
jgi:thiol-disulfide isomerase/thioredoxin